MLGITPCVDCIDGVVVESGDCARTVHESNVFITLELALSEKQIPQIVENIGNQNSGRS